MTTFDMNRLVLLDYITIRGGVVMDGIIQIKSFNQINLEDPFFDTLKEDYPGFELWFKRKGK